MNFYFDANKYSSVFSKKAIKKPELADTWLASWSDIDGNVRHDLLHDAKTNNQAEWGALLMVLNDINLRCHNGDKKVLETEGFIVHGDSQLVIYQVTNKYKVKEPDLKPLYLEAVNLVHVLAIDFGVFIKFKWISRDVNNEALKLKGKIKTNGPDWDDLSPPLDTL